MLFRSVPLSKMVKPKENFVIFLTLFVLFFFLPKFPPHFGVKLLFMLFKLLIAFQAMSSIIKLRMSTFLGHPLTILTFALLDMLVSFFFNLMTTTNLSLNLNFIVSLVIAKLKKGYQCYDHVSHRLRVSCNVVFWEYRLFVELSHFRSSMTISSVLEIFPDESLVPSTNTFDPPLDFSLDILMLLLDRLKMNRLMTSYPTLSLGPLLLLRLKILHKTFHLATQPG